MIVIPFCVFFFFLFLHLLDDYKYVCCLFICLFDLKATQFPLFACLLVFFFLLPAYNLYFFFTIFLFCFFFFNAMEVIVILKKKEKEEKFLFTCTSLNENINRLLRFFPSLPFAGCYKKYAPTHPHTYALKYEFVLYTLACSIHCHH